MAFFPWATERKILYFLDRNIHRVSIMHEVLTSNMPAILELYRLFQINERFERMDRIFFKHQYTTHPLHPPSAHDLFNWEPAHDFYDDLFRWLNSFQLEFSGFDREPLFAEDDMGFLQLV
jgi:hypothetical protein